ncbi:hypothetical protein T4B_14572 [Trichinella pseudospiralis]|uniref:Uncharacterized protein n=1 Tax=Trichinella pseudospiralis TaxID=6337 RepID=A0A0V1F224_TRIPS|nr:hypothetical protein T4A_4983 [Trichinella pseudospiralis]KRZ33099.1 hypothetical protein T4B_14572 [Trichinella pseudospiralis]KRZ39607.1 hypothetical protein T4C_12956 [Trichinella pseudospiralis]
MKTKKETTSNSKRSRCGFCLPYSDRKYSVKCDQCKIFVCPKHRTSSTTIKRSFLILIKIDSALDIGSHPKAKQSNTSGGRPKSQMIICDFETVFIPCDSGLLLEMAVPGLLPI